MRETRTFGEYDLLDELGRGYSGAVYRARHRVTGAIVALKILQDFPGSGGAGIPGREASRRERFQREARSLSAIQHMAVPRVLESGICDGFPFMVRDYFPGQTLRALLDRKKRLPVAEAAGIASQLLSALSIIHAQGIVHRDIKPENLIVQDDGTVRLLDFGCALDDLETSLTRTGEMIGTPAYMAPEQIRSGTVDGRADLWAVGVLLQEMIGGERPFTGGHPLDVLRAIETATPRLSSQVPGWLRVVLQQALEKSPARRFASADAMRSALEARGSGSPGIGDSAPAFLPARVAPAWATLLIQAIPVVLVLVLLGAAGYALLQFLQIAGGARSGPPPPRMAKPLKAGSPGSASRGPRVRPLATPGGFAASARGRSKTRQARSQPAVPTASPRGATSLVLPAASSPPRVCSTCDGAGSRPHLNCHGSGKCGECGGSGHRSAECFECRGTGQSMCLFCRGTGFRSGGSVRCDACGGVGSGKCIACGGKGKHKCPLCGGSGDCPGCRGRGKADCPTCSGLGKVR